MSRAVQCNSNFEDFSAAERALNCPTCALYGVEFLGNGHPRAAAGRGTVVTQSGSTDQIENVSSKFGTLNLNNKVSETDKLRKKLDEAERRAAEAEDFDTAEAVLNIKQELNSKLDEIETQKAAAVNNKDYVMAKELKNQADSIRNIIQQKFDALKLPVSDVMAEMDQSNYTLAHVPDSESVTNRNPSEEFTAELKLSHGESGKQTLMTALRVLEKHLQGPVIIVYSTLMILQSSGYGKTRAIFEVMRDNMCVHLMCKSIAGGLRRSKIVDIIVKELKTYQKLERQRKAVKIVSALSRAAQQFHSTKKLYSSQVNPTEVDAFLDCFKREFNGPPTPEKVDKAMKKLSERETGSAKKAGIDTSGDASSETATAELKQLQMSESSDSIHGDCLGDNTLVIALDEADAIVELEDSTETYTIYRCILRAVDLLNEAASAENDPFRIIVVLLSTRSRASKLIPSREASSRKVELLLCPPVTDFVFVDCLTPCLDTYSSPLEKEMVSLFSYGRSLWASRLMYHSMSVDELVKFALSKLQGTDLSDKSYLAFYSARISMISFRSDLGEELVGDNMATLMYASKSVALAKYLHEPILCEASALYTRDSNDKKVSVIQAVKRNWDQKRLIGKNVGDAGEMAAATALIYTIDILRSIGAPYDALTNNMSKEVPAVDFVKAIVADNVEIGSCHLTLLAGYMVSFNSFYRIETFSEKVFQMAYERRVALISPAGSPDYDFIIVSRKHTDKGYIFAPIIFQIKNWKETIGKQRCSMFSGRLSSPKQPLRMYFNSPLSIGVIMTVGKGGSHFVMESRSERTGILRLGFSVDLSTGFPLLSNDIRDSILNLCGDPVDIGYIHHRVQHGAFGLQLFCEQEEEEEAKVKETTEEEKEL